MRPLAPILVLLGCGAGAGPAPRAPQAAPPPTEASAARARDLAVPEPYRPAPRPSQPRPPALQSPLAQREAWWQPLAQNRGPRELVALGSGPIALEHRPRWRERDGVDADILESELWEPCVREFVRARPERVRRALTAALARYQTACTPDDGVALQGARGLDGRERRGRSDVGFTGTLSAARATAARANAVPATAVRANVSLRVAYCGEPIAAERIVISAGSERWSSPRLPFAQDVHGCEVAELPWTRALARVVGAAADGGDAVVAFEGRAAHDLAVTDEMKQHLRAMLEVLEALDAR